VSHHYHQLLLLLLAMLLLLGRCQMHQRSPLAVLVVHRPLSQQGAHHQHHPSLLLLLLGVLSAVGAIPMLVLLELWMSLNVLM
jgi:hypothetical protein